MAEQASKCGCDEAKRLRAELAIVTAERDYMLTACSPSEIRVMRLELAKEHEAPASADSQAS